MRCEKCGFDFDASLDRCPKCRASVEFSGNTMFYQRAKQSHVKFKDIISGTFKKHPTGTAAKIFAAGTPDTTPTPDTMLTAWQKPWLYSRFLVAGILFLIVGYVLANFLNPGLLAVLGSFGAVVTPFAVLMFIWEMNIPRDISFIKVIAYFFVGGMVSLLFTLILGIAFEDGYEAPIAAFVEEPAKLLITLILMHRAKVKYGFGGMLIGAAVGAGFAVFETIAYVFNVFMEEGLSGGELVFFLRSVLAVGGHVSWAAITGAGAALGRKGKGTGFGYLISPVFWGCFLISIAMHFTWNGGLAYFIDIDDDSLINLGIIGFLCIAAVVVLFILINKCLKQVIKVYDDTRTEMMNRRFAYAGVQVDAAPVQESAYAQSMQQNVAVSAATAAQNVATEAVPDSVAAVHNEPAKPAFPTLKCAFLNLEKPIDKFLKIGRDASFCDIVFPADTAGVSRKHCAVMASPEGIVYVMDLGSSVGTFLPGGKKLQPNEWTAIDGEFYVATEQYTFTVQ